jgi:hypothetical protein
MIRHEVLFDASKSGRLKHIVRAPDRSAAKARVEAAYQGQRISFVKVKRILADQESPEMD